MRARNKGKVYPSPASSTVPPTYTPKRDALSVLKLLPTAILALASVLSLDDREVLAYMITRSMKSMNPSSIIEHKKRCSKKLNIHKSPLFGCECFDCYTSYWFRWDSSPNREVIHQAIEAFEEHLSSDEMSTKSRSNKKKEKVGRRVNGKPEDVLDVAAVEKPSALPGTEEIQLWNLSPEIWASPSQAVITTEKAEETSTDGPESSGDAQDDMVGEVAEPQRGGIARDTAATSHKGLARKVLPDVLGLLNSRWWSLWSPNV